MAFRSVSVIAIREILRRWRAGEGYRTVAAATGSDRKTVRRYAEAASRYGFGPGQGRDLDDLLLDEVVLAVLPGGSRDVSDARSVCREHLALIKGWLNDGCKSPKIGRLLHAHSGVLVPKRTLQRFIEEEIEEGDARTTVRIVDPPPGQVLEIDFLSLGNVWVGEVQTPLSALICVAPCSRHMFVWPCLTQTRTDVIDGLEAAWLFFGGVFPVVIFDNPKTVVTKADPCFPSFDEAFAEYSQERGFLLDLTRVRRPQDKPKVERGVPYARSDGFASERFVDLAHARRHAEAWCRDIAGLRTHGTTRRKPIEAFEDERERLLPAPTEPYDPPRWFDLTVDKAQTVTVAGAIYSVPRAMVGRSLRVRLTRNLVQVYDRATVVKIHARATVGSVCIDKADFPPGVGDLATRDTESLQERAANNGTSVGQYAARVLDHPLPWTRARMVHRLIALCEKHGAKAVDEACRLALQLDVVDVQRIQRMLELPRNASDRSAPVPAPLSSTKRGKYARSPDDFRISSSEVNPEP